MPICQTSSLKVNIIEAGTVHAGFPNPVEDAYMGQPIDLNKELINHPATTFLARVKGDSMIEEGIDDGDLLVVDRSIMPTERQIAVCCIDGEFAVKRVRQTTDKLFLLPANPSYKPIEITRQMDFRIWGVVTWILKHKE